MQEGLILFGFVLVTLGLTLYQEGKTERAIEALRDLTSPRALVIRDGRRERIAGREVVRGDLLLLGEGDRVPADGAAVSANELQVDESLLTGEAVPVSKIAAAGDRRASSRTRRRRAPGGDDLPFVYAGTLVVQRPGRGARDCHRRAQRRSAASARRWARWRPNARRCRSRPRDWCARSRSLALALSLALVLVYGMLRGDWLQALLAGITLAMAMLPEEYPVVLTVFPALGAWRLSREGV